MERLDRETSDRRYNDTQQLPSCSGIREGMSATITGGQDVAFECRGAKGIHGRVWL